MALLPHLKRQNSGRVVNITSIGGKVAVPHLLPYTCAKFAAVGFSEGLNAELQGSGVKVVTIAPGLTISGERAARHIVDAAARGTAEKILTAPANVLAKAHGVAPG